MKGREVQADVTHKPEADEAPRHTRSELDDLLLTMEILEPGDHKHVATLLERHPEFRDAIIAKAQEVCGNDTVAKALELISKPKPQPKAAGDSATAAHTASTPDNTAATLASAKHGSTQPAEEFQWITSPLALEYDHAERVRDHVEFIHKNPHLRDQVMAGVARFEPDLARDVELALRGETAAKPAATEAPAADASTESAQSSPAEKPFEYLTSFLALEYDHEEKVKDHVEFIRANPHLRDQVLIGATQYDPDIAEAVRQRLANPTPAPAETEAEPTPPTVVAEEAAEATPPPASARAKQANAKDATAGGTTSDKSEPGWVRRARIYNAKHKKDVEMFLSLTGSVCLDAEGNLDPRLVARWQAEHGTQPDGRVGPNTVTAAIVALPFEDEAVAQGQGATAPDAT